MPSKYLVRPLLAGTAAVCFLSLGGCSDDEGDGTGTGGMVGTGGATGGAGTGGAGTGGATGGTSSGGASGGTSSGGTSSGGASGGSATGGGSTGGSGSGGEGTGGAGTGGEGTGGGGSGEFTLTSTELDDMAMFASINTCADGMGQMGFGEAIPLEWSGAPEGTQSFALIMFDVTLVDGQDNYLGCHSAFWNVPASTMSMPDADWSSALSGAEQIRQGYLGPCPNFGGGTNEDTYEFTLYAMGDATLSDPAINTNAFTMQSGIEGCKAFRQYLEDNALAQVTLTGTSNAVGGN